jgi:hypothetical protein
MTSMGGVLGFDFDLSLFVVSAVAPDELDAASGVRVALLLLPLTAAGATISGTGCLPIIAPFGGRPFPVGFGARPFPVGFGATTSGTGVGSSLGADFALLSRWAFRLVSIDARLFAWLASVNLVLTSGASGFLILPLPDDGGGGPPGGGAMPAGVSGCGGTMCNTNSFGFFTPFPFPIPLPPYGVA